jgi:hypothetical protein
MLIRKEVMQTCWALHDWKAENKHRMRTFKLTHVSSVHSLHITAIHVGKTRVRRISAASVLGNMHLKCADGESEVGADLGIARLKKG